MKKLLLLLSAMVFSSSALAIALPTPSVTPTIIGYNVLNAAPSGTEYWTHNYTGTIVDLGNGLRDYESGTGTLADGIIGNSTDSTQLFRTADNTSITIFLDGFYELTSVTFFGGPESNSISGSITGATFGPTPDFTNPAILTSTSSGVNDLFTFDYPTTLVDQFTIWNITSSFPDFYSISEIQVSAVPEPSTYALMLGGLGLVGFMAARRRRTA